MTTMSALPKDQAPEALRTQFEALASDPSFKLRRSRRGTYVNPAVARDWKWFQLGASHTQELVAYAVFSDNGNIRLWSQKPINHPDAQPLYKPASQQTTTTREAAAPPIDGEMALIEKAAQRVGIKSLLNHGAGSLVWSEGVHGVTQGDLVAYTREIALHCAVALSATTYTTEPGGA